MLRFGRTARVLGLLAAFGALAGCSRSWWGHRTEARYTSSVVEYLYPGQQRAESPAVPRLALPLRVGVAFVPDGKTGPQGPRLSEKEKMDLMERVSGEFKKYSFVQSIELIPSAYLRPAGGFDNLGQIRTMYGTEVIALLSYDQVQHTDQGLLSLSYWTIVGAYIFKGEKNDTSTMIDAAVYDVTSRKMLFRAPGTSHVKGKATLVNLSEQLREDSSAGFRIAADDLAVNLEDQLARFQEKVKEAPQEYQVVHKEGHGGGGMASLGPAFCAAVLGLAGVCLSSRKRR